MIKKAKLTTEYGENNFESFAGKSHLKMAGKEVNGQLIIGRICDKRSRRLHFLIIADNTEENLFGRG